MPRLSPDIYNVENYLKDDMRVASMLTDFQRGLAVKTPSATEASIIEQSSRLRVDEGLDIVADMVERVMTNAFKLRQEYTTGEVVIPIIGEMNLPVWEQFAAYTREQIQGEYEITIDYGSTQKKDADYEKSQWLQLAPILQNLVVQAQQVPQMALIGRAIMRAHERPEDEIDGLFPQTPPAPPMAPPIGPQGGPPMGPEMMGAGPGPQISPDQLAALLGGGGGA